MDEGGVIPGEVCTRLMLTVLTGWVQSGGGGDRLRHLTTLHTSHQTPTRPGPAHCTLCQSDFHISTTILSMIMGPHWYWPQL